MWNPRKKLNHSPALLCKILTEEKTKEKNSLLSFLALRRTISDKLSKIWQKFSRNRPALFGRILGFKLFQPFFPVALASPTRGRTQEKGSNQANGSP